MPVPRRRHCPSRKNRRRHQHGLEAPQNINRCLQCGAITRAHRACTKCGNYKGRVYGRIKTTAEG